MSICNACKLTACFPSPEAEDQDWPEKQKKEKKKKARDGQHLTFQNFKERHTEQPTALNTT
jgi:hypothetical protein